MIRAMTAEDITAVVDIAAVSQPQYWLRARFEEALAENELALVVEHEGVILGFCVSRIIDQTMHIYNLTVAPLARGYGIAKMLLLFSCAEGRRQGCLDTVLQVRETNTEAIGLYLWFGYQEESRALRYYPNEVIATGYENGILMRKVF